jgi:hypothetical protein
MPDGGGLLDVAGIAWGTTIVGVLINDGNGGLSAPVSTRRGKVRLTVGCGHRR